jgi:predicted glycoside hydrolase/deacetylase ChbG (UPF0249 family)
LTPPRYLVVCADDFGIGPATSQGILDLARAGRVTCTVLLVNSPHAPAAVEAWRRAGSGLEVGWHPCLTLDRPVLPAGRVPSLVDAGGRFPSLGGFVRRLCLGRVRAAEIEAELRAQYERFRDWTGRPPAVVNAHHHVQIFPSVGAALRRVLGRGDPLPYLRRVREPVSMLLRIPGARSKRAFLSSLGWWTARRQRAAGFPGNDWLAGITDPPWVGDPHFLTRWLSQVPGRVVELACHPGHPDPTLAGRDDTPDGAQTQRRPREYHLLMHADFVDVCRRAGFTRVAPSELLRLCGRGEAHAA